MAHQVPTELPSHIIAGDTTKWDIGLSDYPASEGWTLTYEFRGPQKLSTITASNTGDTYNLVIAASVSAAWEGGFYYYQSYVTMDIDAVENRHTVDSGMLQLFADYQSKSGAFDGRSNIKTALDELEASLIDFSKRDQTQMQLAGQMVTFRTTSDKTTLHGWLQDQYQLELDQERRDKGKKSSCMVKPRFIQR